MNIHKKRITVRATQPPLYRISILINNSFAVQLGHCGVAAVWQRGQERLGKFADTVGINSASMHQLVVLSEAQLREGHTIDASAALL
ncbi:hypothetical protein EVAR_55666_1 [Eumeta japonica]|uniref:Uncharacterized protein n=1 Tax=Eumeta variegata TaxID=151549 RepID=A0A4C1ZXJ0_EUMVA|nr:hypothetical protein EVAR_55666_1 [Eumeta japonica]